MEHTRRSLITGIGALLCAPAIVRASSLMPIKPWTDEPLLFKCYEHFAAGPYGCVKMNMTTDFGDHLTLHVGASEPILAGDYIIIRDGYARPLRIEDMQRIDWGRTTEGVERLGVAATSSRQPRKQTRWRVDQTG